MLFAALVTSLIILAACSTGGRGNGIAVTMYKSPTCGCCSEWGFYMEKNGFDVKTVMVNDLSSIKRRYNIPSSMG